MCTSPQGGNPGVAHKRGKRPGRPSRMACNPSIGPSPLPCLHIHPMRPHFSPHASTLTILMPPNFHLRKPAARQARQGNAHENSTRTPTPRPCRTQPTRSLLHDDFYASSGRRDFDQSHPIPLESCPLNARLILALRIIRFVS
jgi:hypothetical protein